MSVELSEELVEFIESGVWSYLATCDRELRPDIARLTGAIAGRDRRSLTVYVAESGSKRALANLEHDRRAAVSFSRSVDHRTIQLKGRVVGWHRSAPEEREIQERYLAAMVEHAYFVGLPRALARRVAYWPSVAFEIAIEESFLQTPGPKAGSRLEPREL